VQSLFTDPTSRTLFGMANRAPGQRSVPSTVDQGSYPRVHLTLVVPGEDGYHGQPEKIVLQPAQGQEPYSAFNEGDLGLDHVKQIATRFGVTEQEVIDMNRRLGGDVSLNLPGEGEGGECANAEGGLVAAASDRADFPDEIDQLLLSVAANHAATACRMARLVDDHCRAEAALRERARQLRRAHDDLETKVAERTAELQRSEAYLAEAQRLSHTGSFGWDVSSGKLYWSEETFRIFECDGSHQPTIDFVLQRTYPQDRAVVQQTIDRARQDRKDLDFGHRLLLPDGKVKHVHIVGHPAFDEAGQFVEFVGTVMDVTERRRADEERQAIAHTNRITTMGQLTASIAHEVNQPIAAAVTNAQAGLRWLGAQPPDLEEVRQALGRIIDNGRRGGEIVGRIRALTNKAPPRKDRLDINEAVFDVVALTRSEVLKHDVILRMDLTSASPAVAGDRIQLQQVVLNLIMNAVEAMSSTDEGARELRISTEMDGPGGVLVSVRDSGPGLDPQSTDRLFEAFYTTKPDGMGMGLAICRSIIEAHAGRLWATGNEPRGAVFQFTLPSERDENASAEYADRMLVE
jgi:C4-dicarboxylate-specific signal transduction histidine kinase